MYETKDGLRAYAVIGGVPPGSVLGHILLIAKYDGVLRLRLPDGVEVVCSADDIPLVVVAKHLYEIEFLANESVKMVKEWIEKVGLELAEHKTEGEDTSEDRGHDNRIKRRNKIPGSDPRR